ncbi:MAG: RNA polymerase sigma factor [bacterium]
MNDSTLHGQWFIRYRDQGDVQAFERVMEVYHQPLYNYIYRLMQNREEAEDALQEVWCKVIRQRHTYQDQGKLSSWLYRIAHNHCLDQFRRRGIRTEGHELIETDADFSVLDIIPSGDPTPADWLYEQEIMQKVERALEQMPVLIRDVYIMRSMQDIPFKEIAEIQQAPLGTVLSRMHQALKYLKQALQTEDQSENQTESIQTA